MSSIEFSALSDDISDFPNKKLETILRQTTRKNQMKSFSLGFIDLQNGDDFHVVQLDFGDKIYILVKHLLLKKKFFFLLK